MKKSVFALLALGTLLLAASCNKEPLESVNVGDEAVVTFSIQADAVTKALSDGKSADQLTYAVYKEGTLVEGVGETLTGVTFPKQLQVKLAKGNTYQVVFFAQDADCAAYTLDKTAKTLAVDYTKLAANEDTGDAFYSVDEVTVTGTINKNVTLRRPLAQINLGTDDYDTFAANNSLGTMSIDIKGVPTTMNLLDGTLTEAVADYSVTALTPMTTEKIRVAGVDYTNLAMVYVLAGDKALTEVTYKINDATPTEIVDLTVSNLPFQRNYRTNILGSFLTGGVNYTINIDNEFKTPDYDAETVLQLALIRGGNVTLSQDYDLEHQLVVPPGVNVVLDLNGHTLSNTKDIWNDAKAWSLISVQGGALTIKGEGKLAAKENDCYAIDVRDGGNLVIEGGEYIGNITAVYAYEGSVEITGGKFSIQQLSQNGDPYRFTLNCYDANYKNGTASFKVSGGTFNHFDPSNNAAEGAGTDFLADGYKTRAKDVWYEVIDANTIEVEDSLQDALASATADNTDPILHLNGDVTLDITAWDSPKNTMVLGDGTKNSITIDLDGHTLTFNQINSDWNNVATGGVKLIIKNGKLTSTGHNDGPWNRHDINFNCDVELDNIYTDKAIALKAAGSLKNVTIEDNRNDDDYALWIQANGQTVSVNGCKILMNKTNGGTGRGITIKDQYVDAPVSVNLSVSNTIFETQKKAAILVTNTAGAKIIWGEGNDISKVAADPKNPVWVDKESAYNDCWNNGLVTAEGCAVIREP